MAVRIARSHSTIPLEREYEGWVVYQLEAALALIGVRAEIAAVSPFDESTWPADEQLYANGKLLGLQFKRPHIIMANGERRCAWDLSSRTDQLGKIKRMSEIYYVLPCFVDRDHKEIALHQCLFWRPTVRHSRTTIDEEYARPRSYVSGQFLSRIANCTLGYRPPREYTLGWYGSLIARVLANRAPMPRSDGRWPEIVLSSDHAPASPGNDTSDDAAGVLYLVAIRTQGGMPMRFY